MLPERAAKTAPPATKQFDVIVIGSGFTGVAAARRIAELEPHATILMVDATSVGDSSAGRNSGFMINLPHHAGHGDSVATGRKQIALYTAGLAWLKEIVTQHGIACGWNPVGKYHAAATKEGERRLRAMVEQYHQWGVPITELNQADLQQAIGTDYYKYGHHSPNNVFIQPAALIRGLADSLPDNVQLWEKEAVIGIDGNGPYKVRTASTTLTAQRVIITNNGFASKLGFARDRVFTIYTYAAMTPVLSAEEQAKFGAEGEWGVLPANRLGTTLRRTLDGRFLVRSSYSYEKERPLADVRTMLARYYAQRYPHVKSHEFEFVWGGVTALTRNGAMYFGEVKKGLYVSLGCNGAGVLKGSVFGKLLGEMAAGHHSSDLADVLGFKRPTWLPPEPVRRIAVSTAIQFQKHIAGLER